ncbi:ABC transporter family substrate-binding protein [Brachybacterium nesterenkovii]|uniref:ABC transporter family substrate-binding protein n=1 Tax=Brachybacterium nesterenkovii TaxID=47847 RepID=UPI003219F93F
MSNRRRFLQGTVVAGGAAALAACSQKSTDEQASDAQAENSKAAAAQSDLPGTAWERLDYDKVKEGGQVTLAVSQLPNNWNYNQADGALKDLSDIRKTMGFLGELKVDEEGKVTLNPDYVESAEVTSEDPQIITVKYNPKAVWSDGTPIVVADLIGQWKAQNGTNEAFEAGITSGWNQIKEIRQTSDEYNFEIEFSTPFADWIQMVHPDVPQTVTKDPETFNKGYLDQPTPSKGPFVVTNIDKTGGVVTLGRNEKWWGRAPKLETVIFKVVDQSTQPQSFANGEIDALDIATGDVLSQAKNRKDAKIQTSNGLTWTHLTINTQGGNGVLADEKVREAIARGINRDAVGQAVVGPLEAPITLQDNFIFMPGQDGYEDSFGGLKYDSAAAEKILEDAGWTKNGDVREKDGKQLALSITIPADTKSNSDRAKQVQSDLNKIGFKIELKTVPTDAYFDENIQPKNFDLVTFSWVGTLFPQSSGLNILYPVSSEQNYTNFDDDATLKPLNDAALGELDPAKRIEASNAFSKEVAKHFTVIPFYVTPNIWGVKDGLVNYGASLFEGNDSHDWTMVGFKG